MSITKSVKQFFYETLGLGQNTVRAVPCLIVTEDGRVMQSNLRAVSGYLLDDKFHQAFLLDHASEVPLKDDNKHVLILDERDAYPWLAGRKNESKRQKWSETINDIASNEWARQKSLYDERVAKDKNIRIILMIFAVVAIILTLILLLSWGVNTLMQA